MCDITAMHSFSQECKINSTQMMLYVRAQHLRAPTNSFTLKCLKLKVH